ncbi:MAG: nucleotide exchange factor GrpE [Flavobacteriaceae bacterium]|nr:nucleotide exchange factor GrpE [Flavobacteriaceae bacterium]
MSKKDTEKSTAVADEAQGQNEQVHDAGTENETNREAASATQLDLEKERERYLRLFAEFENYKKRTGRERVEMFKTAGQEVIAAMLPVLDDFDRALKEIEKSDDDSLYKGVELISNKLRETLRGKGLQTVETKVGDTFDAEIHEAVTQIPASTDDMKGKIIDVLEKGYALGDKIIRYPKVVIGQ